MGEYFDVAVIGGGAAGLASSCTAAAAGCRTVLLERGERVGRKLLVTGNGKCNLTHEPMTDGYYGSDPARIAAIAAGCTVEQTLNFFRSIGLVTRTDREGRVYPYSEQASAVLDVLRAACATRGVTERCGFEAARLEPLKTGFRITASDGQQVQARTVIVACGGPATPANGGTDSGFRLLSPFRLQTAPLHPALVPLRTDPARTRALKGLRVKCAVTLMQGDRSIHREEGELQFGDGLLSGICVFQLSRRVPNAPKVGEWSLLVDLLPDWPDPIDFLLRRADALADCPAENAFTGVFHKKIGYELLKEVGADLRGTVGDLPLSVWRKLAERCRAWLFPVLGTAGFASAQVSAGGILLREVTDSLELKRVPGVLVCGEMLDADGICGGYNLQWAWSTGLSAGRRAAEICGKTGWNEDFSI